jgi:RNA-directed DNA polymerase
MFRRLGAPERTALLLARLCTLDDCLPQGGRASPIISNLAVPDLDRALLALAPRAMFTRYADDITFSGEEGECPSETALSDTLGNFGFSLRDRSYRLQRERSGQIVTGVSLSSGKPSVTRRRRRAIDRLLNIGSRYGLNLHEYATVAGYVRSIGAIDPELRDDWMKRLVEVTIETTEEDDPE